jgi:cytochrome P450
MDDARFTRTQAVAVWPPVPDGGTSPVIPAVTSPVRVTLPDGSGHWMVSRYRDVRTVLSDPRFSADDQDPGFPRTTPLPPFPGGLSFLRMDPPRQSVLRRVLTPRFTVRRIEELRPAVERTTDELLDTMEENGPPTDLIEAFALPLPSRTLCELLGVPYRDHAMFQEHSTNTVATDVDAETSTASFVALERYLVDLVEEKRARPQDDLISAALARQESDALTDEDVVALARLMLIAGHETTANMIGMSVLTLLRQPEWASALRADSALMKPAVEELLRYLAVVRDGIARVATERVRLGDQVIEAGDGVIVSLQSANHDDGAFPDAGRLDLHRDARGHIGFGYGIHQCIGQALARLQLQIALTALLRRFPRLRPAVDLDSVEFREYAVVIGARSLPVTW